MAGRNCSSCGLVAKWLRPETGYKCKVCRTITQRCLGCNTEFTGHRRKYCEPRCQRRASDQRRRPPKPRKPASSDLYYKWRNAQLSGYGGSLEDYAEYRERRDLNCSRAAAWKAWLPVKVRIPPARPRMSQEEQRRYWRRYQRLRRARDEDKSSARRYIQRAVERGVLVKPNACTRCGTPTDQSLLHGHHHDGYTGSAKGRVQWVCVPCHVEEEGGWGASLVG